MNRTLSTLLLAAAASGCALDEPETAEGISGLTRSPATSGHPAVAEIMIGGGQCTASMLSPHWLITAAHCITGEPQGTTMFVNNGELRELIQYLGDGNYYVYPYYDGNSDEDDDIGLIRLEDAGVAGITEQMGIYTGDLDVGDEVLVVAFGLGSDPDDSEWCGDQHDWERRKREQDYNLNGVSHEELEFDWGDAKTCGGDSGAPYIIPHPDHVFADGVHSDHDDWTNNAFGARISAKRTWIQQTLATSSTPAKCHSFVQVDEPGVSYVDCFEGAQGVRPSAISAGRAHACAVLYDGRARCWGDNEFGQLGDNTSTDRTMPVTAQWAAPSGTTLTRIATGWNHTCAVTNTDTATCWGANSVGQLGNPTLTTSNYDTGQPVVFADGAPLTDIRAITAGGMHTCALTWAGRVYCWGANSRGQLGNHSETASTEPTLVGRYDLLSRTRPFIPLENVIAIEAGYRHTCAKTSTNTMVCWGDNTTGQLGDGTTTQRTIPVAVAALTDVHRISAGYLHTCATHGPAGDRASCWGYNGLGQLGIGSTTSVSSPRTVSVGLGTGLEVTAGYLQTCWVGSSKQQKCAGYNASGELGTTSTATTQTLPVSSVIEADARVPAAGNEFTCTLKYGGTVACAGRNVDGQVGANNLADQRYFYNVHHLHHLPGAQ